MKEQVKYWIIKERVIASQVCRKGEWFERSTGQRSYDLWP